MKNKAPDPGNGCCGVVCLRNVVMSSKYVDEP